MLHLRLCTWLPRTPNRSSLSNQQPCLQGSPLQTDDVLVKQTIEVGCIKRVWPRVTQHARPALEAHPPAARRVNQHFLLPLRPCHIQHTESDGTYASMQNRTISAEHWSCSVDGLSLAVVSDVVADSSAKQTGYKKVSTSTCPKLK